MTKRDFQAAEYAAEHRTAVPRSPNAKDLPRPPIGDAEPPLPVMLSADEIAVLEGLRHECLQVVKRRSQNPIAVWQSRVDVLAALIDRAVRLS